MRPVSCNCGWWHWQGEERLCPQDHCAVCTGAVLGAEPRYDAGTEEREELLEWALMLAPFPDWKDRLQGFPVRTSPKLRM